MSDTDKFDVENPAIIAMMRDMGRRLKAAMPTGWCFTLLIQSVGEGGSTFYISSAEREGAIKSIEEFLTKIKAEGAAA
jgi:hypothetical protein